MDLNNLKNTYYFIRHGQSEANLTGAFSAGEMAVSTVALTEVGRKQVRESILKQLAEFSNKELVLISSDLLRARETSEIVAKNLGLPHEIIQYSKAWRERHMGELEVFNQGLTYKDVSEKDRNNPNNDIYGIESPFQVGQRFLAAMADLEERFTDKTILVIGHAAFFGIAQCLLEGKSPDKHLEVERLKNAEIRKVYPAKKLLT